MYTTFESYQLNLQSNLLKRFVKDGEVVETITNTDELESALKKTNKIIFDKYLIILDTTKSERPTCMIVRDAPKSRFGYKIEQNYYYRSIDRMTESIKKFMDDINKNHKRKEDRKAKKKEDRENMVNPFKVGDLLYDSWGYEQTNIDFYQVTRVSKSSAWIRPIGGETVSVDGYMSSYVKPVKDSFKGKEQRKSIRVYGKNAYLSSAHGSISQYTQGDKGVNQTSYH